MSEVKITPLARRLAEENGIDWRKLNGTGPDNTVVERDILNFLARVMAGEVNLPPTPEEVAPPPEDIPNMAQAQALLQREGVQLDDLVPSAPSSSPLPEAAPRPTLDDLDFDIDFETEAELSLSAEPPVAASKTPTLLEMAPEPELPEPPAQPVVEARLPSLEPLPSNSVNPDLEGLPPLPEMEPEPPLPSASESSRLVWETQEVLPSAPVVEPEPLHSGMRFASSPHPTPEPPLEELPPLSPEPLPELPPLEDLPPTVQAPAPQVQASTETPAPAQPWVPEPQAPAEPAPSIAPEPQAVPSAPRMLRVQAWQRLVQVKPALEASATLSEAWRTEVGLYALLYRAVDKALADTQLPLRAAKGSLEGEALRSHRVMPTQTLRGALDALQDAHEPGEGLTVLSLLDSPFDQVVFPGTALLTLGRAAGDHALLSLSGEIPPQEAGVLLERIGYYLERPILLA
ncbi:E3 binding domain-containing protein [Meiothermus granaticius]|uniref:E3 binding domain-containing protein n=2 Tax=Meiothermus granaticius TaxID=863370 RepID=UPI00118EE989|nr:E3 binding domain-containing protein [Meiothermus granaticius]GEM86253.1 hypothetical protein MGR01S_08780 [Meiothermus granaticius NBRC 107808]